MKKNQSSKGSSLSTNTDTTKSINRASYRKTMRSVQVCDAYRKYMKENPTSTKTFIQFKKEYNKCMKVK